MQQCFDSTYVSLVPQYPKQYNRQWQSFFDITSCAAPSPRTTDTSRRNPSWKHLQHNRARNKATRYDRTQE